MAVAPLYAPEIDNLLRFRNTMLSNLHLPVTVKSQALIALLRNIEPSADSGVRSLWISAPRGPISAFGDYDELHAKGEFSSCEEFKAFWLNCYPDERCWYRLDYLEFAPGAYRLTLDDSYFIHFTTHDEDRPDPVQADAMMDWLLAETEDCIRQCARGTYNDYLTRHLPFDMRTGTMLRRDWWEVFPEQRDCQRERIADEDVARFARLFAGKPEGTVLGEPITTMTSGRYFEACMHGYAASGLDLPKRRRTKPRNWYLAFANQRDSNDLERLDENSPEAFRSWYDRHRDDTLAWSVRPGAGFQWMQLVPVPHEGGWSFDIRCGTEPTCIDAAIFALALYDAGLPVSVERANDVLHMLRGEDILAIIPHYVMPLPSRISPAADAPLIDSRNLPDERRQEIINRVRWDPIPEVRIREQ